MIPRCYSSAIFFSARCWAKITKFMSLNNNSYGQILLSLEHWTFEGDFCYISSQSVAPACYLLKLPAYSRDSKVYTSNLTSVYSLWAFGWLKVICFCVNFNEPGITTLLWNSNKSSGKVFKCLLSSIFDKISSN